MSRTIKLILQYKYTLIKFLSNSYLGTIATCCFLIILQSEIANAYPASEDIASSCIIKYLVFDVGSSTTKGIFYQKDKCNGNKLISKQVFNRNYPYQSCLNDSKEQGIMPKRCIIEGIEVMKSIKSHFGVTCKGDAECYAVVTAWARNTKNIQDWIGAAKKINIKPTVASQMYEGEIKLRAMKKTISELNAKDKHHFIVFDIGGASFQLGWMDHEKPHQYHGIYGTDNFTYLLQKEFLSAHDVKCIKAHNKIILMGDTKNSEDEEYHQILQEILHHKKHFCNDRSITTIDEENLNAAIEYTRNIIGKPIIQDKELQHFIIANKPVLIGDSLLFNLGLRQQLGINKEIVTKEDIYSIIKSLAGISHNEITIKYPKLPEICINTTQPAMIILYIVMESLHVDAIHIAQSDHTEMFLHQQVADGKNDHILSFNS